MKKIAVINDLSGFGKCSLSVAMPIISASGIQCCPLTTGVFSNQTCYPSYKSVDMTEYMSQFINEWKKLNPQFDGILTGFIPNAKQGEIICDFIDYFKNDNTLVVVDTVMGDDGVIYPCYDNASLKSMSYLAKKADVITPNLTELCILAGQDYCEISKLSDDELIETVEKLSKKIGKIVITTGLKLADGIANGVYNNGIFTLVKSKMYEGNFSGTGDIMASIITAKMVNGETPEKAVEDGAAFISKAVEITLNDKSENYVTQDGVHFEELLKEI